MGQGEAERARVAASGAGSAADWSCDPGPSLNSSELLCSPVEVSGKSGQIRSVSDQKNYPGQW